MIGVFWHFCLFLTDSVAIADLIGPWAIAADEEIWAPSKALGPIFELDLSKDAAICGRIE